MYSSQGLLGVLRQGAKDGAIRAAKLKEENARIAVENEVPITQDTGANMQQDNGFRPSPAGWDDSYKDINIDKDDEQSFKKGGMVKRPGKKLIMKLAGGGEARAQTREFWKNAPQNPVATPGRANQANPADMMKARLQTSDAAVKARPIPTQTVTPIKESVSKLATNLPGASGAIPIGVQAASQVLDQPIVRDQINDAISTAKDKAGIAQDKTPFNFSKGGSVGYGKGVQCLREGGPVIGPGTGTSDSISAELPEGTFIIPADAVDAIGYEKLMELKDAAEAESPDEESAEVPAKISNGEFEFTPEEVEFFGGPEFFEKLVMEATGHGTQPEVENGEVHAAYGGNIQNDLEAQERINKMLNIKPKIVTTQTPDLTATPGKNGVVANPTVNRADMTRQLSTFLKNDNVAPKPASGVPFDTRNSADVLNKMKPNVTGDTYNTTRLGISGKFTKISPQAEGYLNQQSELDNAFKNANAPKVTPEPVAAKTVNQGSWKKPIVEAGGKLSQLLAGASGAIPTQAATQVLDQPIVRNQIDQGISKAKDKAGIAQGKTPFNTNLAKFLTTDVTSYNSTPTTETPVVQPRHVVQQPVAQQSRQAVEQPVAYTGGWTKPADIANWQEDGRRKSSEGVAQTLPWGHQRFTNSGDTEKDTALNDTLEAEAQMRMQKSLSEQPTRDTYEAGPNGGYSRTTEKGGYAAQLPENQNLGVADLRRKQENADRNYDLKAKTLAAKLSGKKETNNVTIPPENVEDVQAALSNFDSEDETARKKSRQFLYKWFPDLYNSTVKQSLGQGG